MEPSSLLCPSCELCPVSSRLALVLFHFRFLDPLKKITSVLTLSSVSEVSSRILAFSHSLRNRCNCDFASRATVSRISYRINLFDGKNEKNGKTLERKIVPQPARTDGRREDQLSQWNVRSGIRDEI